MLFTKAADYLTDHIGPATTTVGPPKRLRIWLLSRATSKFESVEVKLREGPAQGLVRMEISDPYGAELGREEEIPLLQETDFALALERVRAHTGR